MERLTYDFALGGNHCWQVKGADNLECREVCERQGDNGCKTCPIAKAFDRLAAIEDILGDEYDLDELREMVQAKREGRCVVPPCKVGQKVKVDVRTWGNVWNYKTVENGKFLIGEIVAITKTKKQTLVKIRVEHNVSWKRPTRRYPASAIGKTVFLARAEAESALRREQDGNNK